MSTPGVSDNCRMHILVEYVEHIAGQFDARLAQLIVIASKYF